MRRIAAEVGTPTYVYSRRELTRAYRAFDGALDGVKHRVCFSVKANSSLGVLSVLAKLGAGADIVSAGELTRWQRAGGDPTRVVFSGVGKTVEEMRAAIHAGILCFNVESEEELLVLGKTALAMDRVAPVAIRVNPDVDPQTHPYISTGLKQNKFGVAGDAALALLRRAATTPGIRLIGVDCHIGSQLTKTSPFADAIARVVELILQLAKDGIRIELLDIGGGLGIDYGKEGDAAPPTTGAYGTAVKTALAPLAHLDLTIVCEPGRAIVGPAGSLLTRVIYRKQQGDKHFTIVDAAMNDLMRPVLYGSHHPMQAVTLDGAEQVVTDVVGPICETGDFFARDRSLPLQKAGALLSIGAAGAYGFTMASNYNTRPRAAEIMVDGDNYTVIRKRETVEQLLQNEIAI